MAHTYRNAIRRGNACGSNTEYYRNKRHSYRPKLKEMLHNTITSDEPDDNYANPEDLEVFVDRWREPTDGHGLIRKFHASKKGIDLDMKQFPHPFSKEWMDFCKRKWYSKLKSKHCKRK